MEGIQESPNTPEGLENIESSLLDRFRESLPGPKALALVFAAATSACTTYSNGISSVETSGGISLSGAQYCERVDFLSGRVDGSTQTILLEGSNGTVEVIGVVIDGEVVATVRVTVPGVGAQTINCE